MSQKIVNQGPGSNNVGWPTSFDIGSNNQAKFQSRGTVTVSDDTGKFTAVGGNSGNAPVFNYSGTADKSYDLTGSASDELTSNNTNLTIGGGTDEDEDDP